MSDEPKSRGKTARRAPHPVIDRRVEDIIRIRLDGAEFWDVREFIREKEGEEGSAWQLKPGDPPLSDNSIWWYITRAGKACVAQSEVSRKRVLKLGLAKRRNLYAKSVLAGDYRTALAVLSDTDHLLGIYPPKKTERKVVKEKSGDPAKMSDDELTNIAAGRATGMESRDGDEGRRRNGTTRTPKGESGPVGHDDIHDAHLPSELAPPGDQPPVDEAREGRDEAADAVQPATPRQERVGESSASGNGPGEQPRVPCD